MDWQDIALQSLGYVGALVTLFAIGGAIYAVYRCTTGILPVLIRLGNGLTKRKIAVFAQGAALDSLEALFKDSNLFSLKNIIRISCVEDFGRATSADLFLVHWPDWQQEMHRIIQLKRDSTAMVIYAPQGKGFLPPETVEMIEQHRNVVLANLRGRLLNDVVVSLITVAYEKR